MSDARISAILEKVADELLTKLWRAMRDDKSDTACAEAAGALVVLKIVGVLNPSEVELWLQRFERCPGHEDEGGWSWCAYGCLCGKGD